MSSTTGTSTKRRKTDEISDDEIDGDPVQTGCTVQSRCTVQNECTVVNGWTVENRWTIQYCCVCQGRHFD